MLSATLIETSAPAAYALILEQRIACASPAEAELEVYDFITRCVLERDSQLFDRIALESVDGPEICDAVVGPEGFYHAFLRDGFSRGG